MTKIVGTTEAERRDEINDIGDEEQPQSKYIQQLSSQEIVPGDIVYLKKNTKAVCDMILLEGECLVDEAVLTGESVPCSKIQLPKDSEIFNSKKNRKNIIFCGSKII